MFKRGMEHGNDIFAMYILIWNTTKIPLPCANFYKTRERSYFPLLSSRFFPVIFFLSVSAHGKACQTWHHPLAWNSVNRIFAVFRAGRHATKATLFSEQKDTRQRSFAVPFIIVLSLPWDTAISLPCSKRPLPYIFTTRQSRVFP
jgi:hypothetical protein